MDKRTRVLNAIQQKEVDHVPVGFWYHFDGDQALGDPCVQAHLDYYESTGLDFIKIMCDGYFPYPVPESVKTPADWKSLKPRSGGAREKDRGGQGQGDVRVLQRVRAVLLHPFRHVG